MRAVVIDLDKTIGRVALASWLRHQAGDIEAQSAGGRASVADDMRYIAEQIDDQVTAWGDRL